MSGMMTLTASLPLLVILNAPDLRASEEEMTVKTVGMIEARAGRLVDEYGRQWLLNGVNARVEGIFDVTFDDGRERLEPIPEFDQSDADAMVHMGFNFLRLCINWSGLETKEGEFSEAYLQKIDVLLEQCRKAGLYVLIDFHQDAWSKEIGEDGAPLWAIIPPPEKPLCGPLNDLGKRRVSKAAVQASQSFFFNREGIQDRFMPAWRLVGSRYAGQSHVIGFEPMNEPVAMLAPKDSLLKFYERVAVELRKAGAKQPIWLEPDSSRNAFLSAPLLESPFPDSNVVYEPHLYPPGLDGLRFEGFVQRLTKTFDDMVKEGASWGGPVVIGEWGWHPNDERGEDYFDAIFQLADERQIGLTFWLWKENCQGWWGFYDFKGAEGWAPRTEGINRFCRPRALAVPGILKTHGFDPKTGVLKVTVEARGGEVGPLLHIPAHRYPDGFAVILNDVEIHVAVDEVTQRCLLPWKGEAGEYRIEIRPRKSGS